MFSALDDGRSAQALPTALVGVDGIALLGWHGLARASQFTCHVLTLGTEAQNRVTVPASPSKGLDDAACLYHPASASFHCLHTQ